MNIKKNFKFISDLASVNRYSQSRLNNNESVLEHSGGVSLLCYFIGVELRKFNLDVDFEKLLSKAILHDCDEVVTGDIAMPVKYHSMILREEIGKMEQKNVLEISLELTGSEEMFDSWKRAKDGKEGAIVSLCDSLSVLYKLYDEVVMRGNKTLGHINKIENTILKKSVKISYLYGFENFSDCRFLFELCEDCKNMQEEIEEKLK